MTSPNLRPTLRRRCLHRCYQALRAVLLTVVAVPGLGLALLGLACQGGDSPADAADAETRIQAVATQAAQVAAADTSAERGFESTPPVVAAAPGWVVERAPEPEPVVEVTAPAPVVAPVAPQPADVVTPASELTVVEAALATGVESRQPVGVSASFDTATEKVWAWVKVENRQAPTTVTMVWKQGDRVRSTVELHVGTSPRWRTWSRRRVGARDVGPWTVEVRDAEDRLLETLRFEVTTPRDGQATTTRAAYPGAAGC